MTFAQAVLGLQNCVPSLLRITLGVGAAFILGVVLGFARYSLPEGLRRNVLVNFLIEAPRYPPPIAWIPFVILWVGIGELSAVLIVVIGAFFPVFTSTYSGMWSMPRAILWASQSFELSRWQFFRSVLFPAALPQILSGLRIGLGMGWMSVIAAEMIGADSGLGYTIQLYRVNMQYGAMAYNMALIALVGYLLTLFMNLLERRALRWMDVKGESEHAQA
jgi:ABC-type nitrate/sulfonate/bicarbonate transport system permease component